ncbi:MAG: NUDIX hydrolase [Gammaproteobacteria bacterium]
MAESKPTQKFCMYCGSPTQDKIPEGDNKERAVCTVCGAIHYQNPKIVSGCILEWENKILLCKRATEPRSGFWTLPAGFLENNETVVEGALRETFEEATAKSDEIKLFFMCDLRHISQIYMMYVGELLDGKYAPGPESEEVRLFSESDIPWDDIAFSVIEKTLRLYFEDKKKGHLSLHFDTIDPR